MRVGLEIESSPISLPLRATNLNGLAEELRVSRNLRSRPIRGLVPGWRKSSNYDPNIDFIDREKAKIQPILIIELAVNEQGQILQSFPQEDCA